MSTNDVKNGSRGLYRERYGRGTKGDGWYNFLMTKTP